MGDTENIYYYKNRKIMLIELYMEFYKIKIIIILNYKLNLKQYCVIRFIMYGGYRKCI